MFYKFSSANSSFFFALLLIVLASFIFSLSSCTTTDTYTINEPKTIEHDGVITINKVIMKDSTVYNFKKDEAVYKKKYKDTSEVILCKSDKILTDSVNHKISREKYLIFLKDISSIKYKREYVSTADALLTGGGIIAAVLFIFYIGFYFSSGLKGWKT
jgi:hypothetical protein